MCVMRFIPLASKVVCVLDLPVPCAPVLYVVTVYHMFFSVIGKS